jgi:hypothetical protein
MVMSLVKCAHFGVVLRFDTLSPHFLIEIRVLGMCYILCMCVCVGASDTTTASDDPFT